MRTPYIEAFKNRGEEVVVLDIFPGSDFAKKMKEAGLRNQPIDMFKYAISHLECNLKAPVLTDKKCYSTIDKVVIIAHGHQNHLQFCSEDEADNPFVFSEDIYFLSGISRIKVLDIQACECGKPCNYSYYDYFDEYTCIAYEFAKKEQIECVYAWTDKCKFLFKYNFSISGGIYEKIYMVNNQVIHKTVKANEYFEWIPLYRPLEY